MNTQNKTDKKNERFFFFFFRKSVGVWEKKKNMCFKKRMKDNDNKRKE